MAVSQKLRFWFLNLEWDEQGLRLPSTVDVTALCKGGEVRECPICPPLFSGHFYFSLTCVGMAGLPDILNSIQENSLAFSVKVFCNNQ